MADRNLLDTSAKLKDKGKKLDDFIRERFPKLSKTAVRMIIRLDGVWVNEINIRNPAHLLRGEETVLIEESSLPVRGQGRSGPQPQGGRSHSGQGPTPHGGQRGSRREHTTPPRNALPEFSSWIVFEDAHLLVVNKPAGIAADSQKNEQDMELLRAARDYLQAQQRQGGGGRGNQGGQRGRGERGPQLSVVHRIDRSSSGILPLAKTSDAQRKFTQLFRGQTVKKQHLVLVSGSMSADTGTLRHWIRKNERENRAEVKPATEAEITAAKGEKNADRLAITHYEVKAKFPKANLLLVTLESDHSHQVRAQLAFEGHPILGDQKYGKSLPGTPNVLGPQRMGLHMYRVSFEHPLTKKPITIEAPLADDLEDALEKLPSMK